MYWKQSEEDDQQISERIHNGTGVIKRRSLFEKRSRLPIRVEIWELDVGGSEGSHIHNTPNALEEVYYFLEGKGEMIIDGKEIPVRANDSVMVPPGTDHGIKNTGDIPLKVMIIWGAPAGEYQL